MTQYEQFLASLGQSESSHPDLDIHHIDIKLGRLTLVEIYQSQGVKDPDAPLENCEHGESHAWRSIRCSGQTFIFLNGAFQNLMPRAGYQLTIGVTERNLLDDLEMECRRLENPVEKIMLVLKTLDQVRRRNLECAKRGVMPTE